MSVSSKTLAKITIGDIELYEVNFNPKDSGLKAPVGSKAFANLDGTGKAYIKTGSLDTDWSEEGSGFSQTANGDLDFAGHKGVNLADPVSFQDAASKGYVDTNGGLVFFAADGTEKTLTKLNAIVSAPQSPTPQAATVINFGSDLTKLLPGQKFTIVNNSTTTLSLKKTDGATIIQSDGVTPISIQVGHIAVAYLAKKTPETWFVFQYMSRGNITINNQKYKVYNAGTALISNLVDPIQDQDAASKKYVDNQIDSFNFIELNDAQTSRHLLDLSIRNILLTGSGTANREFELPIASASFSGKSWSILNGTDSAIVGIFAPQKTVLAEGEAQTYTESYSASKTITLICTPQIDGSYGWSICEGIIKDNYGKYVYDSDIEFRTPHYHTIGAQNPLSSITTDEVKTESIKITDTVANKVYGKFELNSANEIELTSTDPFSPNIKIDAFSTAGGDVSVKAKQIKLTSNENIIVSNSIVPDADVTYDLGSATHSFKDLYLSGNTIKLGGTTLSDSSSGLVVKNAQGQAAIITDNVKEGTSNLYYKDSRVDSKLQAVSNSIVPDTDVAYDLGSTTHRFRDLYLSGHTIKLGATIISDSLNGLIAVDGDNNFAINTDNVGEGTNNLFFTQKRVQDTVLSELDASLSGAITSSDSVVSAISKFKNTIADETSRAIAAETSLVKYIDDSVAGVVDSAPEVLNTLKELSSAINNDASFAASIAGLIGTEQTRAQAVETSLASRITNYENSLTTAISIEQSARIAADNSLASQISALAAQQGTGGSGAVSVSYSFDDTTYSIINASQNFINSRNSYSLTSQPDGKTLLSGYFTDYLGVSGRNYLVRLNSDWSVDTAFCQNASDMGKFSYWIKKTVVQPDGKILVIGSFTNYGGVSGRNYLIRLNQDGTVDSDFCLNVDGKFGSVAPILNDIFIQKDGKIIFGGYDVNYTNNPLIQRKGIVRLNSNGTIDTDFDKHITQRDGTGKDQYVTGNLYSGNCYSICSNSQGQIFATGYFDLVLNATGALTGQYYSLVVINPDNTINTDLMNKMLIANPLQRENISFCTAAFDDSIFITKVGGNGIVKLNSDGTTSENFSEYFNANSNSYIAEMIAQPDNKLILRGNFGNNKTLIRLNADGTLDTKLDQFLYSNDSFIAIEKISLLKNGILASSGYKKIIGTMSNYDYGLFFLNINEDTKNWSSLSALNSRTTFKPKTKYLEELRQSGATEGQYIAWNGSNWSPKSFDETGFDEIFMSNVDGKVSGVVTAFAKKLDGSIFIAGSLNVTSYNANHGILKFNSNGILDQSFINTVLFNSTNPNGGVKSEFAGIVYDIKMQSDGKIIIVNDSGVTRLKNDETIDAQFASNFAASKSTYNISVANTIKILILPDDEILLSVYNGTWNNDSFKLLKLKSDGSIDIDFLANVKNKFDAFPTSFAIQSTGKIIVGGRFNYNNTSGKYVVRLNPDGTEDTTFPSNLIVGQITNPGGGLWGLKGLIVAVQPNDKILIGGDFANYGNTLTRNNLIRINADDTLDLEFIENFVDNTKFNARINDIVVQTDGQILILGDFDYGGVARRKAIRITRDNVLDTAFCTAYIDGKIPSGTTVYPMTIASFDNIVLIGCTIYNGYFNNVNGRNTFIKINANTKTDSWNLINIVSNQVKRAVSKVKSADPLVVIETSRAIAAEASLSAKIDTETSRAQAAETSISSLIDFEASRAIAAETSISTALASEISRASAADTSLANSIASEASRATAAETGNGVLVLTSDGSTYTMTLSSARAINVTGSSAQTIKLPPSPFAGLAISLANSSSGTLTIQDSAGNAVTTIPPVHTMIARYNGTTSSWAGVQTPFRGGSGYNFGSLKGYNLLDPTSAQDAATKNYIDLKVATAVSLSALDIDWSAGSNFYKSVGADTTFTFSNLASNIGKTIFVRVFNNSSTTPYLTSWPSVAVKHGATLNGYIAPNASRDFTFIQTGAGVMYVGDVIPPQLTLSSINNTIMWSIATSYYDSYASTTLKSYTSYGAQNGQRIEVFVNNTSGSTWTIGTSGIAFSGATMAQSSATTQATGTTYLYLLRKVNGTIYWKQDARIV